jgi:hypothetical protein
MVVVGGIYSPIPPTTIPVVVVDGHTEQSGVCHVSRPLGFGAVDR